MVYPSYPELITNDGFNVSQGLQVLPQYANSVSHGLFMNLLILVLFFGISLSSYFVQLRTKGDANLFSIFSVIGLAIFIFMLMLSIISSLIGFPSLIVAFFLEIIFISLFFMTKRNQY